MPQMQAFDIQRFNSKKAVPAQPDALLASRQGVKFNFPNPLTITDAQVES